MRLIVLVFLTPLIDGLASEKEKREVVINNFQNPDSQEIENESSLNRGDLQ